jgi:predicted small lipoprotein YifL
MSNGSLRLSFARGLWAAALLVVVSLVLASCGKKGPPLPPLIADEAAPVVGVPAVSPEVP